MSQNPSIAPLPRCTEFQVQLWLRGLLTLAWADGDFDPAEQQLVADLTQQAVTAAQPVEPITTAELQAAFGADAALAEDFLRTAVMVAIADGIYTTAEDDLLTAFGAALGTGNEVLAALRSTLVDRSDAAATPVRPSGLTPPAPAMTSGRSETIDPLQPVRQWLDGMQVQDPQVARFLCRLIPSQCPFERDIVLFGKKVVHIPPMCKLNPLYEQLVGLRFRALSYLADDRGEDVSPYL
jgi:tellurite resistance protein